MPFASSNGASLYYEATGAGFPLVFVHEFGGDYRSWEPQVRYFSRRYLCVTYNARGYPPSDVPKEPSAYSQAIAPGELVTPRPAGRGRGEQVVVLYGLCGSDLPSVSGDPNRV